MRSGVGRVMRWNDVAEFVHSAGQRIPTHWRAAAWRRCRATDPVRWRPAPPLILHKRLGAHGSPKQSYRMGRGCRVGLAPVEDRSFLREKYHLTLSRVLYKQRKH